MDEPNKTHDVVFPEEIEAEDSLNDKDKARKLLALQVRMHKEEKSEGSFVPLLALGSLAAMIWGIYGAFINIWNLIFDTPSWKVMELGSNLAAITVGALIFCLLLNLYSNEAKYEARKLSAELNYPTRDELIALAEVDEGQVSTLIA